MAREQEVPQPSVPGRVRCLRCDAWFQSPDRVRLRICPSCTRVNAALQSRRMERPTAAGRLDDASSEWWDQPF